MPGGNPEAWPHVKEIFQAIAAKVEDGSPCCDWVGEDGAGHYVKMVHNGIEYGDMQLICEAYQLMKDVLGLNADELHEVFAEWNKGELDSYLIDITSQIFAKKDDDGTPIVDKILDTAGQKGTGKWTCLSALDLGMPVTLIGEAVFSRCLSAIKDERVAASAILQGPERSAAQPTAKRLSKTCAAPSTAPRSSPTRRATCCCARRPKTELEPQLRRHRADVARRLHHPQPLPGQDQGSLRQEPEAEQSAAR